MKNWRAYIEMTKPRLLLMVMVTAAFGFFLGNAGIGVSRNDSFQPNHPVHSASAFFALLYALAGIALGGAGASVLNQYLERDVDARMERTRNRPLPKGVISPLDALTFGMILVMAGIFILVWKVNLLASFLVLLTAFLYVLVYTPMKRLTWWNTTIGAIPGAIPPMAGWAAASGHLEAGAWIFFLILFLWQHPHFYAIAWLHRDDYSRGDFKMLPVVDPDGRSTFRQIIITSVLLLIASLAPFVIDRSAGYGWYLSCAALLSASLVVTGLLLARMKTASEARLLFRLSLLYLPCLCLLVAAHLVF